MYQHRPLYSVVYRTAYPLTVLPTRETSNTSSSGDGQGDGMGHRDWECDEWNYSVLCVVRGVSIHLKERRVTERSCIHRLDPRTRDTGTRSRVERHSAVYRVCLRWRT